MGSHKEIERRFLVKSLDLDGSIYTEEPLYIRQGYLLDTGYEQLRIRVINENQAKLTRKVGKGMEREEEEMEIPLSASALLFKSCRYTLEKRRYLRDSFEIDRFDGALAPLILIEREFPSAEAAAAMEQPAWVREWQEVTEWLSNAYLARVNYDLAHHGNLDWVSLIPNKVPQVVLTGGPCSGKSTVGRLLASDTRLRIQYVPEMATILIKELNILPATTNKDNPYTFNRTLYAMQRHAEEASQLQAIRNGCRTVLVDRGTVDNAGYLPGGTGDLQFIGGHSLRAEYDRYAAVICMAVPPKEVFEREKGNNPARFESWEQAMQVEQRLKGVWGAHHGFRFVSDGDWEAKVLKVRSIVNSLA